MTTALQNSRQTELIVNSVQKLVYNRQGSLLDIGGGKGALVRALLAAKALDSYTIIEPNLAYSCSHEDLAANGVKVMPILLHELSPDLNYDVTIASHVLYDVARSEWGSFIDNMLSHTVVGGRAIIVMNAPSGALHLLREGLWPTYDTHSGTVTKLLGERGLAYTVERQEDVFITASLEEMLAVMDFAVLGGTIPADAYRALNDGAKRAIHEKLRNMAEATFGEDRYVLPWQQDVIIIERRF